MSDITTNIDNNDLLVNLKTLDKESLKKIRLLPRTKAEAIIETEDQQFISKKLKDSIYNKQDILGYTPLNKAGDIMTGALYLKSALTEDDQAVNKKYVDDKIKALINSSPEALDTLYELAKAINNDPNFAATITNLISTKLDSSEVSNIKTANKLLRLDSEGELVTDLKGNAATATKLKNNYKFSIGGDFDVYTFIDGSKDVNLDLKLPIASSTSSGIISPEDYSKFSTASSNAITSVGTVSKVIQSSSFIYDSATKLYTLEVNVQKDNKKIGLVQVFQEQNGVYNEINADITLDWTNSKIIITSVIAFNGHLNYNFIV